MSTELVSVVKQKQFLLILKDVRIAHHLAVPFLWRTRPGDPDSIVLANPVFQVIGISVPESVGTRRVAAKIIRIAETEIHVVASAVKDNGR